jgi:hypothetical protein
MPVVLKILSLKPIKMMLNNTKTKIIPRANVCPNKQKRRKRAILLPLSRKLKERFVTFQSFTNENLFEKCGIKRFCYNLSFILELQIRLFIQIQMEQVNIGIIGASGLSS